MRGPTGVPHPRELAMNPPVYSLAALLVFVVALTILVVRDKVDGDLFVALVIAQLPSLVASINAERAAKDIRNGVLAEKARQGASQAIEEHELPAKLDAVADEQTRQNGDSQ